MYPGYRVTIKLLRPIFCVSTWVPPIGVGHSAPNDPCWTISTLFFWYLCFPFLLPRMQKLTDKQIAYSIVKCFWLQLGFGLLAAYASHNFANFSLVSNISTKCFMS